MRTPRSSAARRSSPYGGSARPGFSATAAGGRSRPARACGSPPRLSEPGWRGLGTNEGVGPRDAGPPDERAPPPVFDSATHIGVTVLCGLIVAAGVVGVII